MIEWMKAGNKWTKTKSQRGTIHNEIERLTWHDIEPGLQAPMSQGLALKSIMQDVRGRHEAVAWDGVLYERYCLLGLQTRYKNGVAKSYWIDTGTEISCLCADFTPDEIPLREATEN
jgi:hypothetical protein